MRVLTYAGISWNLDWSGRRDALPVSYDYDGDLISMIRAEQPQRFVQDLGCLGGIADEVMILPCDAVGALIALSIKHRARPRRGQRLTWI